MVYAATLSKSQMVMRWWLILEEFGYNIHNISGVKNILADTISILKYTYVKKYEPSTSKDQCCATELFVISWSENNEDWFPLNLLNVQREQQRELIKENHILGTYISDQGYVYSNKALDKVKIICYDSKIYAPQNIRRCVLYWYPLYLKHPGGSRLAKKFNMYVTRKTLSRNHTCMLSHARYVNGSKRKILFMDICHLRTL